MTKTYKVYHAAATEDKELVFSIDSARDKDAAIEKMTDSRDGFMVTMETGTHAEILAVAKWGKNSFTLGTVANENKIKTKAEAAATLDRLPRAAEHVKPEPEKVEKKVEHNENGNQKRRGRPPVVRKEECARLFRAYLNGHGTLEFNSTDYEDIERARQIARDDHRAFVLVSAEKESGKMRTRGTFNAARRRFGPNQVVTIAELHKEAIKIIGGKAPQVVPDESNVKTPVEEAAALKEASERMDDAVKNAVKDFNAKKENGIRNVEIVEHNTNHVHKSPKEVAKEVKRVTMESPSLDQVSPKEIAKELYKDEDEKTDNKPLDPVKTKEALVALGNGVTKFWDRINGKEVEDRPKLPALSSEKPVSADDIYDAIIDNQHAVTQLMIAHVEAQGALKSLDTIVSEHERQRGLLETRMMTLKEESDEAAKKAEDKREELKVITRKIANLLGGAEDATN